MVLLIHRTRYRDVTLPKGKVDPGEMLAETAVREIFEETGIRVALGVPVGVSRYRLPSKRQKIVHYWAAEATDAAIRASAFVPNREIAALEWVTPKKAQSSAQLSGRRRDPASTSSGSSTRACCAPSRSSRCATPRPWAARSGTARTRRGRSRRAARSRRTRSSGRCSPSATRKIISSPATRCVKTVTPLSAALGRKIDKTPLISQDAWEEGKSDARTIVGERVRARKPAVLCSHGPVLPEIMTRARPRDRHAARLVPRQRVGARARRLLGRAHVGRQPRIRHRRDRDARTQGLTCSRRDLASGEKVDELGFRQS